MDSHNQLALNLFLLFTGQHAEEDLIMGTECLKIGLRTIYNGTGGGTRTQLNRKQFTAKFASHPSLVPPPSSIFFLLRDDSGEIKQQYRRRFIEKYTRSFWYPNIPCMKTDRIKAVSIINRWVEKETNGHIQRIAYDDTVNLYKRGIMTMVITSQFSGSWEYPFIDITKKVSFHRSSSSTVDIDMMFNTFDEYALVNLRLEEMYKATVVKFPYVNKLGAMVIIMPIVPANKSIFSSILQRLQLEELFSCFEKVRCSSQSIPKFNTETKINLNEAMGLHDTLKELIAEKVDFSNILDGSNPIKRINFQLLTTFTNTECGPDVVSRMEMDLIVDNVNKERIICLDRPFLYFIVSPENYIFSIGIFAGGGSAAKIRTTHQLLKGNNVNDPLSY